MTFKCLCLFLCSQIPGRDLNLWPPVPESEVLSTAPSLPVWLFLFSNLIRWCHQPSCVSESVSGSSVSFPLLPSASAWTAQWLEALPPVPNITGSIPGSNRASVGKMRSRGAGRGSPDEHGLGVATDPQQQTNFNQTKSNTNHIATDDRSIWRPSSETNKQEKRQRTQVLIWVGSLMFGPESGFCHCDVQKMQTIGKSSFNKTMNEKEIHSMFKLNNSVWETQHLFIYC